MKLKPISMSMLMHMACAKEHHSTYRNDQYGLTKYATARVAPGGKNDCFYVIDGDETEYRDLEKLKAALVEKFPELEDKQS